MKIPKKAEKLALLLVPLNLILFAVFVSPVRSFFAQAVGVPIRFPNRE